jgi:hypothetical protein
MAFPNVDLPQPLSLPTLMFSLTCPKSYVIHRFKSDFFKETRNSERVCDLSIRKTAGWILSHHFSGITFFEDMLWISGRIL